jgi:hypothetical protein
MSLNQRWQGGLPFYRPPDPIRTAEYDVDAIAGDTVAKAFIEQHHYSGTYPAARFRFGLYHRGALAGVAVFSHPCNDKVLTSTFPGRALDSVELGRFVLLDEVPGNGETWFLARCFEQLRAQDLRGVVSFSDPVPRQTREGLTIFRGHIGTIYQAHNGAYRGRGTARTLRLLPDGSVVSARALQKIRRGERGWHYAAEQLVAFGADPCEGNRRVWLRRWLPRVTRTLAHPGNFKYAWPLRKGERLASVGPYPKVLAA